MRDKTGRRRRFHSLEFKRRVVALTYEAGASVAEVSRLYGLNDNMVFRWRRELQRALPDEAGSEDREHVFLPVEVTPGSEDVPAVLEETLSSSPLSSSQASASQVSHSEFSPAASVLEVSFGNGRRLRLPVTLADDQMRRLIRLVERP